MIQSLDENKNWVLLEIRNQSFLNDFETIIQFKDM